MNRSDARGLKSSLYIYFFSLYHDLKIILTHLGTTHPKSPCHLWTNPPAFLAGTTVMHIIGEIFIFISSERSEINITTLNYLNVTTMVMFFYGIIRKLQNISRYVTLECNTINLDTNIYTIYRQ